MKPETTLFLIRCGQTSAVAQRLASGLAAATGRLPVFVCDERRGPVSAWDCPKIILTDTLLDGIGLAERPQNWGWLCGDFCYYAAQQAFPDYQFYCLLDADLFMSAAAAENLVALLAVSGQQALAVRLGAQAAPPRYSRGLAEVGLPADLGCIFPFSRVHSAVISRMHDLRCQTFSAPNGAPNDEAILAGAVALGGFSAAALDQIAPELFGPASFDTNPPHLFEGISQGVNDTRIYHPVATADEIIARLKSGEKAYGRHRLRKVLRQAPPDALIRIEDALHLAEAAERSTR